MRKGLRDIGYRPGRLPTGERNSITDVPGVRVGHSTISDGDRQTGVTAILPRPGDMFREKLPAAYHVINGFGKTTGLIQIRELGVLETPILLTNTLSVGTVWDALARYMLKDNPDIGRETGTVNPVVCECNDGYLNDIRGFHVTPSMVYESLESADDDFKCGAVGAGRGMSCYELKGGIGTASRTIRAAGESFVVGALLLTNFGSLEDLVFLGRPLGFELSRDIQPRAGDPGSVITILATNAPLSSRQLGRLTRRAVAGLSRTGSAMASGSGEIVLAFSTAYTVPHYAPSGVLELRLLHEDCMDSLFRAAVESVEEAVLDSLWSAETTRGRDGHVRYGVRELAAAKELTLAGDRPT